MAVHDRVSGPAMNGITDVATTCTKDGCKPGVATRMSRADLSEVTPGKASSESQPSSRTGENPPYGNIGGSRKRRHHSKPGLRLDPIRLDEHIGIVGLISNQRLVVGILDQRIGATKIMRLARREHQLDWFAQRVDEVRESW
jgi:hypothetical protein